jgi:hypothetical protein
MLARIARAARSDTASDGVTTTTSVTRVGQVVGWIRVSGAFARGKESICMVAAFLRVLARSYSVVVGAAPVVPEVIIATTENVTLVVTAVTDDRERKAVAS